MPLPPNPTTGMTTAAQALRYWERRQQVVANNLANVSTTGFKAERVFAHLAPDATPVLGATTDLRAGAFTATGGPLDVALEGNGFLVVQTPRGERLSRGGSLSLDASRRLTDGAGNLVLGEAGPITLPEGPLTIERDGAVKVNGAEVAKLRVESVPTPAALSHEAGGLFAADATRQPVPPEGRAVRQGFLEGSNVSSVDALVEMITVQRAYGAIQRTMTTLDEIRGTIANDLGRPV